MSIIVRWTVILDKEPKSERASSALKGMRAVSVVVYDLQEQERRLNFEKKKGTTRCNLNL